MDKLKERLQLLVQAFPHLFLKLNNEPACLYLDKECSYILQRIYTNNHIGFCYKKIEEECTIGKSSYEFDFLLKILFKDIEKINSQDISYYTFISWPLKSQTIQAQLEIYNLISKGQLNKSKY